MSPSDTDVTAAAIAREKPRNNGGQGDKRLHRASVR